MTPQIAIDLAERFFRQHGCKPAVFRAPGRVNLIGEHTDYNDGFVLPMAISLATYIAAAPRSDRRLRAESLAFKETAEFALDDPQERRRHWSDYVFGVALALERAGFRLKGADLMIDSDLPMGAGLSASAALEVCVAEALTALAGLAMERTELALLCQRAENDFVGAQCGIMDQLICACAVEGSALLIDCRSLAAKPVAIDPRARILVCDSMVRHELASGEYNLRRRDCEDAAAALAEALPGIKALRDVSEAELAEHGARLVPQLLRRARHVVSENARALRFAEAMAAGDLAECGQLMFASHASLARDFEASCEELDLLVALARQMPGLIGARMMGGGFGGSTINLVDAASAATFAERLGAAYADAGGKAPGLFWCSPSAGAGRIM
jgi:galactokinase